MLMQVQVIFTSVFENTNYNNSYEVKDKVDILLSVTYRMFIESLFEGVRPLNNHSDNQPINP